MKILGFSQKEKWIISDSFLDIGNKFSWDEKDYIKYFTQYKLLINREKNEGNLQVSARTNIENNTINIRLYDGCFNGCYDLFKKQYDYAKGTIVHELAHVIDISSGYKYSDLFLLEIGGSYSLDNNILQYNPIGYGIYKGTTKNGHVNHYDDFAESFATYIYGSTYDQQGFYVDYKRLNFIEELFGN